MHKITIVFLLSICIVRLADAQVKPNENNQFTYTEILTFEGKTEKQLFDAVRQWGSTNSINFQRKNEEKMDWLVYNTNSSVSEIVYKNERPLTLSEPENGKNIIRVVTKYNGSQVGALRRMFITYDLKIITKDGKLKFEAENFNYEHFNSMTGKSMQLWGLSDKGDCSSKGTFETLANCKAVSKAVEKMLSWLSDDITQLKTDLVKKINTSKNERDF